MVDEKRIREIRKRHKKLVEFMNSETWQDMDFLLAAYDEAKEKLNLKQRLLDSANAKLKADNAKLREVIDTSLFLFYLKKMKGE